MWELEVGGNGELGCGNRLLAPAKEVYVHGSGCASDCCEDYQKGEAVAGSRGYGVQGVLDARSNGVGYVRGELAQSL